MCSCAIAFAGLAMTAASPADARRHADLVDAYRAWAQPLTLDPLIDAARDKQLVLLGESTHGTAEYYTLRAEISQRLIEEHGFSFIAVEGDWVSLARLNRYVKHKPGAAQSARAALLELDQWPHWMWANEEFAAFGEWLHDFNRDRAPEDRVGIYGMDVYAPWAAMDAVIEWFAANAPQRLAEIESHYEMFGQFRGDPHRYVHAAAVDSSGREGVSAARTLMMQAWEEASNEPANEAGESGTPDRTARNHAFFAKQAAAVVEGAEQFYRESGTQSWNRRVDHMAETVDRLRQHYGEDATGIVWAHNTHIGDASATAMARSGQYNIGQLARQTYGRDRVFLTGFATDHGAVLAARHWEGEIETMPIPRPKPGSFEAILHDLELGDALLTFPRPDELPQPLQAALDHRAIGVIYMPPAERSRNYVPTIPALRYDALIYLRATTPLTPLH